jgi:hypothetical protein
MADVSRQPKVDRKRIVLRQGLGCGQQGRNCTRQRVVVRPRRGDERWRQVLVRFFFLRQRMFIDGTRQFYEVEWKVFGPLGRDESHHRLHSRDKEISRGVLGLRSPNPNPS